MNLKLKTDSPVVLVKAGSDDSEIMTTSFAVVEFDNELIELISKLKKAREDSEAYEVTKFAYQCEWLSEYEFAHERDEESMSDEDVVALEEFTEDNAGVWQVEPTGDVAVINDDGTTIHVSDFGVKFTAYIKHTNTRIYTEKISFDIIDKLTF